MKGVLLAQDALLPALLIVLLALGERGPLVSALCVAIPVVLLWGMVTLHFPSQVTIDEDAVVFRRYGREHRFPLAALEAVTVRRFLVKDRVLVRLVPSPPWRGRYWLVSGIPRFDELVRELTALEARLGVARQP